MHLLPRTNLLLMFSVAMAANWVDLAMCQGDEQTVAPLAANVEVWIQGLNDPSYRTRRESFLRLCDRTIPIDAWLEIESANNDRHRSAMATWLKRLRRSSGTLSERAEMLRDYEALKNLDDSVIDRYMADSQWDRLVELIALVEPGPRNELLRKDGRLQLMLDKAWKSGSERIVPRLLDLVLKPTERVQANRKWKSLEMPEEWKVSQSSNLPSVKIVELEADGKIDEAVALAEKSALRNFVEPMLIRSNRWDKWFAMDLRRTPILSFENIEHQRAGMFLMLGQFEETNALLDELINGPESSELSSGTAALSLAVGRTTEFEAFLEKLSEPAAFAVMRMLGNVHGAFEQVGLNDLSVPSVKQWLDNKGYMKRPRTDEAEGQRGPKASPLADFADLFFQIGLIEQGQLIDSYLLKDVMKKEGEDGISAWVPLFNQWLKTNERNKVIYHWKAFLVRNASRRLKTPPVGMAYRPIEREKGPFEIIYSDFPVSASLIYDYLLSITESDAEHPDKAIEIAISQLEDLHAGRLPRDWIGQRPLLDLRKAVHMKSLESGSTTGVLIELAKLFDSLGETHMAIESLDLTLGDPLVNQVKAEFLIRLGQLDAASDILIDDYRNDPSDIKLMVECTDTLASIGRFGEMDRYMLQGLSSSLDERAWDSSRSDLELPPRKLVQMVMEQRWQSDKLNLRTGFDAARCLNRQFGELAKKDLSYAKQAANYARVESLLWMKLYWPRSQTELGPLALLGDSFQSLILEAIANDDRELADKLYRAAFRCKPQDIDMPIIVVPVADRVFGKELADEWFDLFFQPMLQHLDEFPNDQLIGNNTAWLAALCNRNLEKAQSLASKVAVSNPDPTYLDTLAEVEYRLGNVDRAIELSELCLSIEPKDKQHREQLKRFRAGKP